MKTNLRLILKSLAIAVPFSILFTGSLISAVGAVRKTVPTEETKDLARPSKVDGVPVYIMSDPQKEYTVVDNFSTDGMVVMSCPDIDKIVEYYVKRCNKAKITYDAVLYNTGKKCVAIKWK